MSGYLAAFSQWLITHPDWAGLAVFLIALSESLVVAGLLVPGALLMLGIGALVATGALSLWPVLGLAVAGAIVGDGISFWLGHHYHQRVRAWWPFRNHPQLLEHGERFIRGHGGKSVFIARFVGPVRPLVPVVAGMLGMPPGRFYAINLLSALLWAPAYILPGMAIGASLVLAGEVAGRLALLLGLLLLGTWVTIWVLGLLYRWLEPHARYWTLRLLRWARWHPSVSWLLVDLLDPTRPVSRGLLIWLLVLLAGSWLFLGVLEDVISHDPLVYAGQSLYTLLQGLRTPVGDHIMVICSELGDSAVIMPLVAAVLVWMLWQRRWRELLYWLAAIGFAVLAVGLLKHMLHFPRPVTLYSGIDAYSFPSGHATMSMVVYGYLAVLGAEAMHPRWHWLVYAATLLLVGLIALSRLYLGAHWLADVAGGIGLGSAWVALLAVARHYHIRTGERVHGIATLAPLVFATVGLWHVNSQLQTDIQRYTPRPSIRTVAITSWWRHDWRRLPALRIDLEGEREQAIDLQWAGDLDRIDLSLTGAGWQRPVALDMSSAMRWLLPQGDPVQLPVLPHFHAGHHEVLRRLLQDPDGQLWILRLWPADTRLSPGALPLWIGVVSDLRLLRLPLLNLPRQGHAHAMALHRLDTSLSGAGWRMRRHTRPDGSPLLLIRPQGARLSPVAGIRYTQPGPYTSVPAEP